ncbi:MAG: XdhC family protein [Opitutus sp.]|nr:XdhC family protein [Opitutus sp.]
MKEIQAVIRTLLAPDAGESVLATLVTAQGSSYRRPGARLLVTQDGTRVGSISGGCLEEDVLVRAQRVAATGQAEAVVYDTTSENDLVWGVGLGCHGIVHVLLEKLPASPAWAKTLAENFAANRPTTVAVSHSEESGIPLGTQLADQAGVSTSTDAAGVFRQIIAPPTRLVIFGAGDDAQPLARLAKDMGWHVTVADPRPAFATVARFAGADAIVVGRSDELVNRIAPGADALAVVMTHHYVHDVPIMRALLSRPLAYLGLLGPKKRADKILADLEGEGVALSPANRARLHAPVGLDLGVDNPEQVALAIVAEIQAVLTGRSARPLRERQRPIHE